MHRDRFYVSESLELHLFFLRIMKEHSLFLAAGFTPVDAGYAAEAKNLKQEFERLLCRVVAMSDSMVRRKILASEEIVTEFTAEAERQTVCFTGIPINGNVTQRELRLNPGDCRCADGETVRQVEEINRTALRLVCSLIDLKNGFWAELCAAECLR